MGLWGRIQSGPESPQPTSLDSSATTMKALGHQGSWSPGPQVHPPFQEALGHPNVSARASLTDLPTSSRCQRAKLEAAVRQGWGVKGAPSPHWLPGRHCVYSQTRKAVPCSLLPSILWSVSGPASAPPPLVVSPNKPHSQSCIGVPSILSLEVYSVSGRF